MRDLILDAHKQACPVFLFCLPQRAKTTAELAHATKSMTDECQVIKYGVLILSSIFQLTGRFSCLSVVYKRGDENNGL